VIENRIIYFVFWILNEYICIETRKIISTKYLIDSMCFSINTFLVLSVTLIKWISLQIKIIYFLEQNLNTKTTLFMEEV